MGKPRLDLYNTYHVLKKHTKFACFIYLLILPLIFLGQIADAGIIEGNPHGRVNIVEVFDYQCPHCHTQFAVIERILRDDPRVKITLFPVGIMNPTSKLEAASVYAMAISKHPVVGFQTLNQSYMRLGIYKPDELKAYWSRLGFRFAHLNTPAIQRELQAGIQILQTYHTQGVPLVLIKAHGKVQYIHYGQTPYPVLEQEIKHVMV